MVYAKWFPIFYMVTPECELYTLMDFYLTSHYSKIMDLDLSLQMSSKVAYLYDIFQFKYVKWLNFSERHLILLKANKKSSNSIERVHSPLQVMFLIFCQLDLSYDSNHFVSKVLHLF